MADKKLTVGEIKKALEHCAGLPCLCSDCILFEPEDDDCQCSSDLKLNALDLINRLQAENERLKGHQKNGFFNLLGNCLVFSKTLKDYNDMRKGLKAEAYKEFVDLLKAKADELQQVLLDGKWAISQYDIDKLLKEKVGSDLF